MDSSTNLSQDKYDYLLETVWDICASRRVKEIVIGLTADPNKRTTAYLRTNVENFVILITNKTAKTAIEIEKHLFKSIKTDRYWKSVKNKYNKKRIDGPYRASLGGKTKGLEDRHYSVYVAWKQTD